MFLSKKTATSNKPKPQESLKPKRVLGGWNDDEEEKPQPQSKPTTQLPPTTASNHPIVNLLESDPVDPPPQAKPTVTAVGQPAKGEYLDWQALNDRTDIGIEKGLVEDIVKSQGIRIKQTDTALNDFLKEVRFLEISTIGSLLLSKLEVNYPFQVKAKALYAIEFLVKKNPEYLAYFRAHVDKLRQFPQPEDNVENYRKIWRTLMNVIGMGTASEEEKRQFVDPGYNTEEVHPLSSISSFIHENAAKGKKSETGKTLVGPGGQNKPKDVPKKETNLLDFEESSLV